MERRVRFAARRMFQDNFSAASRNFHFASLHKGLFWTGRRIFSRSLNRAADGRPPFSAFLLPDRRG
jgi:hypothetical protein